MWPIQLAFHCFTVLRMIISSLILFNNFSFSTLLIQLIFFSPFHKGDGWHFLGSCNLAVIIISSSVVCTVVQALRLCTGRTAHRMSRGIALLFRDHGTRRGWGVSFTPRPLFTHGKTRYPLYRMLNGTQDRSGQVRKISLPPGFDPRTVQPVASRYTDYATRSTRYY